MISHTEIQKLYYKNSSKHKKQVEILFNKHEVVQIG